MPGLTSFAGAQPQQTMSSITSLKEFLAWRGFGEDEAYTWARCFYKYTDCGPWVVFLMRNADSAPIEHPAMVAKFRNKNGQATLTNHEDLSEDFLQLLGFDEHGLPKSDKEWDTYRGLADKFIEEDKAAGRGPRMIEVVLRTTDEFHIRRPGWVEPMKDYDREIYYEDRHEKLDPDLCVGIKFGSIVEGSEVCSGPFIHLFPFDGEDFSSDLELMDQETDFYWIRDNSQWYSVEVRSRTYYVRNTWGDIVWEGDKPSPKLRKKVEEFIQEHFGDIPQEPGFWAQPETMKKWRPAKIPNSVAEIYETINDTIL